MCNMLQAVSSLFSAAAWCVEVGVKETQPFLSILPWIGYYQVIDRSFVFYKGLVFLTSLLLAALTLDVLRGNVSGCGGCETF